MASVPYDGVPQTEPSPRPPEDFQHIQVPAQNAVAQGLQQAGEGALKLAEFQGRVNVDDQVNEWITARNNILDGDPAKKTVSPDGTVVPDLGYMGLTGRAASDQREATLKSLEATRQAGLRNLASEKEKYEYDLQTRRMYADAVNRTGTHSERQWKDWAVTVNQTGALHSLNEYTNNLDNPEERNNHRKDYINFRVQQAQIKYGDDPDIKRQVIASADQDLLKAWTEAVALKGDPMSAARILEKNKDIAGAEYPNLFHKFNGMTKVIRGQEIVGEESEKIAPSNFANVLRSRESGDNATKVNQFGYAGLYQFGAPRLADLGVYRPGSNENLKAWSTTPADAPDKWHGTFNIPNFPEVKSLGDFLRSPPAQQAVFQMHKQQMDREINRSGLDRFIGTTVAGVPITRDGLYGMIHLGGVGGTRTALNSGGAIVSRDANGTSLFDYAKIGAITSQQQAMPDKAVLLQKVLDRTQGDPELQAASLTYLNHQYTTQQASYIDQERKLRVEEHQKKEAFNQGVDDIIKDSVSPTPQITAQMVAADNRFQGRDKEYAMQLLNRPNVADLPAAVSARNTRAIYDRMMLPDGDPNKITDLRSINEAYAHGSRNPTEGINRGDHEWLTKMFREGRTEEGGSVQKQLHELYQGVQQAIDKSLINPLDQSGKLRMYQFMRDAETAVSQARERAKTSGNANAVSDLFNSNSPNFLGSDANVMRYQKPLQSSLRDAANRAPLPPPPAPQPAQAQVPSRATVTPSPPLRQSGESIADYMVRTGLKPNILSAPPVSRGQ